MSDIIQDAAARLTESIIAEQEQLIRNAILGTDWRETSVLRIIINQPNAQLMEYGQPDAFEVPTPEYEIERYDDRAPPMSEYDNGKRSEVLTITWPLLLKLAEESEEMQELAYEAIGPEYDWSEGEHSLYRIQREQERNKYLASRHRYRRKWF